MLCNRISGSLVPGSKITTMLEKLSLENLDECAWMDSYVVLLL